MIGTKASGTRETDGDREPAKTARSDDSQDIALQSMATCVRPNRVKTRHRDHGRGCPSRQPHGLNITPDRRAKAAGWSRRLRRGSYHG